MWTLPPSGLIYFAIAFGFVFLVFGMLGIIVVRHLLERWCTRRRPAV